MLCTTCMLHIENQLVFFLPVHVPIIHWNHPECNKQQQNCPRTLAGKIMPFSLKLKLLKHRFLLAWLGFYLNFFFAFPSAKSSEMFTVDKNSSKKSFKSKNGRVTNSVSLFLANFCFLLLRKNLSYWSSFCENQALIKENYLKHLRCKF